jgi:branched-subunit amino acid transport protein
VNGFTDWTYMAIAIGGLTVITFLTRSAFFLLPSKVQLPPAWDRALRHAPACALAAIVAPSVLTRDHQPFIAWDNHQLWAVLVAVPVFVRWRSMTVLIGVGMAVFTLLRLI